MTCRAQCFLLFVRRKLVAAFALLRKKSRLKTAHATAPSFLPCTFITCKPDASTHPSIHVSFFDLFRRHPAASNTQLPTCVLADSTVKQFGSLGWFSFLKTVFKILVLESFRFQRGQ